MFLASSAAPGAQHAGTVATDDLTYVLPVYEQFLQASDVTLAAELAKLRSRIGPDGPYVRLGFTTYIPVNMNNLAVDLSNPAAVLAGMQGTIDLIDRDLARARALGFPICLSFLTAIRGTYDPVQVAAEATDVRNTQWFGGKDPAVDNTISPGWMTHSRYARRYQAVQEAYLRELGKVLANRMALYPDTLVAAAGDGEIELSFDRSPIVSAAYVPETMSLADYSPIAVAEFRDWLTASGLYAAGQPFDGQAYRSAFRYTNNLAQVNRDFGTSFTNFQLRYFDWSLSDEAGSAIALSQYSSEGFNRHPATNPGGFDAPRVRDFGSAWWLMWLDFRRQMVWRHNVDFAKWITTSVDSGPASGGTGATVPATRWYSYQIPADRLWGFVPPDQDVYNTRYETSASAWWTGDISPFGGVGITSFNGYSPQICGNADPKVDHFCRTLAGVAPEVAKRNLRWAILEWHPGVGDQSQFPPWSDVYGEEMKIIEQYRPHLVAPYALYTTDPDHLGQLDLNKPFYDSAFETSLKALVTRLNQGPGAPNLYMMVDDPAAGASLGASFEVRGWAVDLGTTRGSGWSAGIERVEVSASRVGGAETLLGVAKRVDRADVGAAFGAQFTASGYSLTVGGLSPGQWELRVVATGRASLERRVTVTVAGAVSRPLGYLDMPRTGSTVGPNVVVSGWVADLGASSGTGIDFVDIWAWPIHSPDDGFVGTPIYGARTYGVARSDVGAAYGSRFTNSGYSASISLPAGAYRIVAYAHDSLTNTNIERSTDIAVSGPSSRPLMEIDEPTAGLITTQPFLLRGWAIDLGATSGVGIDTIHVWAQPVAGGAPQFVGVPALAGARPDIAAVFGMSFLNAEYRLTVSGLPPGTYDLGAYAHSTVSGTFNQAKLVRVTVR